MIFYIAFYNIILSSLINLWYCNEFNYGYTGLEPASKLGGLYEQASEASSEASCGRGSRAQPRHPGASGGASPPEARAF